MAYGIKIQTMFGLEEIQNTQFAVSLVAKIVYDNSAGTSFSGTYQLPAGYTSANCVAWDSSQMLYTAISTTGLLTYGTQNNYAPSAGVAAYAPIPVGIITIYAGGIL